MISNNSLFHECTNHIEIDLNSTYHHLQKDTISYSYVPSTLQIVNILTMPFTARFHFLSDKLSMLINVELWVWGGGDVSLIIFCILFCIGHYIGIKLSNYLMGVMSFKLTKLCFYCLKGHSCIFFVILYFRQWKIKITWNFYAMIELKLDS